MQKTIRRAVSYFGQNPALVAALVLAILLSLLGSNWGRIECWNLDSMAFRGTKPNGLPYCGYLKPPLHTYLNHILVMKPVEAIRVVLGADHNAQYPYQLMGARLITLALFCGAIIFLYRVTKHACGATAAGLVSLLTATSAGLIMFNHYGTADSPLLFWMTASFAMAIRAGSSGRIIDAVMAGALAGLAAADKYNGLGVAVALPVAFLCLKGWKSLFSIPSLAGAAAVPLGFIIGNPGAIFDTRNFVQDFLYNLYTTPVYDGKTQGAGYVDFLLCFPQLIGWPASVLLLLAVVASLILLLVRRLSRDEKVLLATAGAVFLFYFITIGRFPRMADRFVLPVVPFAFFLCAPALGKISWRHPLVALAFGLALIYNIFCSVDLGLRFLADPRMEAVDYAGKNFAPGSVIESTYSPSWQNLPGLQVVVKEMPYVTGRTDRFTKIFGENKIIQKGLQQYETKSYPEDTFTASGLKKRNPDYITFSNQVFQFSPDDQVQAFYHDLQDGKTGYVTVFDKTWRPRIPYTYPPSVGFMVERMIILKRAPDASSSESKPL